VKEELEIEVLLRVFDHARSLANQLPETKDISK
jgi:hypothetical protein